MWKIDIFITIFIFILRQKVCQEFIIFLQVPQCCLLRYYSVQPTKCLIIKAADSPSWKCPQVKGFESIIKEAEELVRELLNVPDNYKVLFLQGGASTQFAAIPLNFMNGSGKADFIITGQWANKAYQEAAKYGQARIVASSKDKTFSYIPKTKREDFDKEADYVHICLNNTIYGTKYHEIPDVGDIRLSPTFHPALCPSLLM